jgi:hypothetical protein
VIISLVYAATRHEESGHILSHAARFGGWVASPRQTLASLSLCPTKKLALPLAGGMMRPDRGTYL